MAKAKICRACKAHNKARKAKGYPPLTVFRCPACGRTVCHHHNHRPS